MLKIQFESIYHQAEDKMVVDKPVMPICIRPSFEQLLSKGSIQCTYPHHQLKQSKIELDKEEGKIDRVEEKAYGQAATEDEELLAKDSTGDNEEKCDGNEDNSDGDYYSGNGVTITNFIMSLKTKGTNGKE